jgi:hypothetical protein
MFAVGKGVLVDVVVMKTELHLMLWQKQSKNVLKVPKTPNRLINMIRANGGKSWKNRQEE